MGFKQTLEGVIAKKRNTSSARDPKAAACLLKKWKALRKFCAPEKRTDLAIIFVAFCEGRISNDRFCQKVKAFRPSQQQRTLKKSMAAEPKSKYYWKPSPRSNLSVKLKMNK
ncbi:MAG: hypothetical protein AAB724_00340 [Patescibacteria group bacterium]